ncbi:Ribosome-recycling factor [Aquisphaera giovannonii]|uniref:Ribosome-recycling factor n=1 Tax=Aquisphaera giovannonii TaxID=406548 RepID=A0A5B9W1M4_9BACT|nr:ribosome-recycling factor [Aquisphaera giovannonii]QEH33905.1 Ribosome-recycling factor [Aquisphaera giovannonii]
MASWEDRIRQPVEHLADQLRGIRPGAIGPGFVETFVVECQGSRSPIGRIAAITTQAGRIIVAPFDRAMVPAIVKSLADARQNAYALDPARVCVTIPPLSGEQRDEVASHVKALGEKARVAVRSVRQDIRKQLAASGKRSDRVVQELTDGAMAEIDRLVDAKLVEISGDSPPHRSGRKS